MTTTICDAAGKAGGSVVKGTMDVTKYVKNKVLAVGEKMKKAVRAVKNKIWSLCCKAKTKEDLSYWESQQKEVLQKIGQEVLTGTKLNASSVLEEKKVKAMIDDAQEIDKEIQKVKNEQALQKQKMELEETVERAKSDLKSENKKDRRVAVRILERIATRSMIPYLTELLSDSDPEVRSRASKTINKLVNSTEEIIVTKEAQKQPQAKRSDDSDKNESAE